VYGASEGRKERAVGEGAERERERERERGRGRERECGGALSGRNLKQTSGVPSTAFRANAIVRRFAE